MAEQPPPPKGGRLENPGVLRERREKVLERYQGFKEAARQRREKLEGARKFQQFRRDADELESWISEKIHLVSDEAYKDGTNLQVQPHRSGVMFKKGGGADGNRVRDPFDYTHAYETISAAPKTLQIFHFSSPPLSLSSSGQDPQTSSL